jgi:hypothetical protein
LVGPATSLRTFLHRCKLAKRVWDTRWGCHNDCVGQLRFHLILRRSGFGAEGNAVEIAGTTAEDPYTQRNLASQVSIDTRARWPQILDQSYEESGDPCRFAAIGETGSNLRALRPQPENTTSICVPTPSRASPPGDASGSSSISNASQRRRPGLAERDRSRARPK